MPSIPFSASSHAWDTFDLDGVLHLEPSSLVIEYEGEWTKYDDDGNVIDATKWEPTRFELEFNDIASIEFQRRVVRASRLLIQARSIQSLQGFPLARGVKCEIPIKQRYRSDAEHLVSEVQFAISDAALRGLLRDG